MFFRFQFIPASRSLQYMNSSMAARSSRRQYSAMVVSIDKATALKMHDKVRKYWAAELERRRKSWGIMS